MKKRILMLLSGILILGLALAACGPKETTAPTSAPDVAESPVPVATEAPDEPDEPVVLRIGTMGEPDCLHPFMCSTHYVYVDWIYEGFNIMDPATNPYPRLAKSMEVSEDGLTWTLELQDGVTYSDGEPFNAFVLEDFFDWIMSVDMANWFPLTMMTESWAAVDENTFQVTTFEPVGSFPRYSAYWVWPLPPHIWGELDDSAVFAFDNSNPIGTGPYVLTEWVRGEYLIYDAREDYWGGPPPIDRIVIQIYTNWDSIVQALMQGEVDATDLLLPAQYYDILMDAPNVTVTEQPPGFHYFLVFNMAEFGTKHPAIDDPEVRKAIDYAIDRQQLLDVAMLGHGVICPTDWGCGPLFEDRLDPTRTVAPYDIDEANRILDAAGYADTDGDGVRETADGQPLEFRLFFDIGVPIQDTLASMVSDWLSQIGIVLLVEAQDSGLIYAMTVGERDFDISLQYWPDEPDPVGLDFYLSCWSAEAGLGALNWSAYCNPEFDDVLYGLLTTVGWENRAPISYEIGRILNEDRPMITLLGENFLQAYRSDRFKFGLGNPTMAGLWDGYSIMRVEVID